MKKWNLKSMNVLLTMAVGAGLTVIPVAQGWAQEKCKRSGTDLAKDSKYVQQHMIDVGDVPGHQVRILELHRTPTNAKPNCEGLKVVESWTRGYSDYTNFNGRSWGYTIEELESGDKIFSQYSGTTQTTIDSGGTKKTVYTGVTTLTGGTGKYRGVRGMGRNTSVFDAKAGFNENQWETEYWIEN